MTVGQLIRELGKHPAHLEVLARSSNPEMFGCIDRVFAFYPYPPLTEDDADGNMILKLDGYDYDCVVVDTGIRPGLTAAEAIRKLGLLHADVPVAFYPESLADDGRYDVVTGVLAAKFSTVIRGFRDMMDSTDYEADVFQRDDENGSLKLLLDGHHVKPSFNWR